jgi:hypothetical protein
MKAIEDGGGSHPPCIELVLLVVPFSDQDLVANLELGQWWMAPLELLLLILVNLFHGQGNALAKLLHLFQPHLSIVR